jgi:glycosyltransferase involved in cell wall biosynthesis
MAWSWTHQDKGDTGVVLIVPPWPYSGSANIFAAQVAAHAAQGYNVFVLAGPIEREHCADRVSLWSHAMQGLSFPDASFVRYASNHDAMLAPRSRSFGRWLSAGQDDALAISARYAADADLPLELAAFIYHHRIPFLHVNHCFEARLGQRIANFVEQVQGQRPTMILDTHDIQATAFHAARKRNPYVDHVDSLSALRATEIALCRSAKVLIHCAPEDMSYFVAKLPQKRHALLLPSLDPRTERQLVIDRNLRFEASFDFVYVGNNNMPNLESVVWLLNEVVPHLHADVRLGIVGGVGELLRSLRPDLLARFGAMVIGEVEAVDEIYRRSKAIIAPALSGTGTSIKLIEGLCAGKPMVVTSLALRGLPAIDKSERFLQIEDRPEDFAAAMNEMAVRGYSSSAQAASFYDRTFSGAQYAKHLGAIVCEHVRPESAARKLFRGALSGNMFRPMTTTFRLELPSPLVPTIFRQGWHDAEPFGRWTAASRSELLLVLPQAVQAPMHINLELARPAAVPLKLAVNDHDAGYSRVSDFDRPSWRVEHGAPDRILRLIFDYGAVTDPYRLNSEDARPLGLAVQAITIEAREAATEGRPKLNSVLMCKTFAADLPRFEILVRSIARYNQSSLPFVVCAPHADLPAFRRILPADAILVAEEEFVEPRCFEWLDGWRQQQVAKLSFYRLGISDRYLAIDSDCYFIRPFDETDLFGMPAEMRVVAQTSEPEPRYGAFSANYDLELGVAPRTTYSHANVEFWPDPLRIPECFLRDRNYKNSPPELARSLIPFAFSAIYHGYRLICLPPPMLFSAEILAAFEKMIIARDLSFVDLIHMSPWEAEWYGHFAMKYFGDRVRTVTPIFKHYTTDAQLAAARCAGVSDETLARNFLGVNLAARHQADLRL